MYSTYPQRIEQPTEKGGYTKWFVYPQVVHQQSYSNMLAIRSNELRPGVYAYRIAGLGNNLIPGRFWLKAYLVKPATFITPMAQFAWAQNTIEKPTHAINPPKMAI